jgi:hypothetical protein
VFSITITTTTNNNNTGGQSVFLRHCVDVHLHGGYFIQQVDFSVLWVQVSNRVDLMAHGILHHRGDDTDASVQSDKTIIDA